MPKQKISLNIPEEILLRVDELAKAADMDRTRLIVNILDESTKTLMACKKVGVYQFSLLMRDLGEKMEEWANKIRKKKVEPLD